MAAARRRAPAGGKASPLWLVGYFVVVTIGELHLAPVGLALVSRLAPARVLSLMMGLWFAATFPGDVLGGWLGGFWSTMDKPHFFLMIALDRGGSAGSRSSRSIRCCASVFDEPRDITPSAAPSRAPRRVPRAEMRDHFAGEHLDALARQLGRQRAELHRGQQVAEADLGLVLLQLLAQGRGLPHRNTPFSTTSSMVWLPVEIARFAATTPCIEASER